MQCEQVPAATERHYGRALKGTVLSVLGKIHAHIFRENYELVRWDLLHHNAKLGFSGLDGKKATMSLVGLFELLLAAVYCTI